MHGQTHFCHRDVANWSNCAVMLIDCLGVYSTAVLITTYMCRCCLGETGALLFLKAERCTHMDHFVRTSSLCLYAYARTSNVHRVPVCFYM